MHNLSAYRDENKIAMGTKSAIAHACLAEVSMDFYNRKLLWNLKKNTNAAYKLRTLNFKIFALRAFSLSLSLSLLSSIYSDAANSKLGHQLPWV